LLYSSSSCCCSAAVTAAAAAAGARSDTWRIDIKCAFAGPTATPRVVVYVCVKRQLSMIVDWFIGQNRRVIVNRIILLHCTVPCALANSTESAYKHSNSLSQPCPSARVHTRVGSGSGARSRTAAPVVPLPNSRLMIVLNSTCGIIDRNSVKCTCTLIFQTKKYVGQGDLFPPG